MFINYYLLFAILDFARSQFINLDLAFLSIDISPDHNYLYINEYDEKGYLSYLKLADY